MISTLNLWTYAYDIVINFIAHLTIFTGAFYVALHNRNLPRWHITPLWYVGLFSMIVCVTILVQWTIGSEHALSYYNMGKLAETLVNCSVAAIALVMLIGTVRSDLRGRKHRAPQQQQ